VPKSCINQAIKLIDEQAASLTVFNRWLSKSCEPN